MSDMGSMCCCDIVFGFWDLIHFQSKPYLPNSNYNPPFNSPRGLFHGIYYVVDTDTYVPFGFVGDSDNLVLNLGSSNFGEAPSGVAAIYGNRDVAPILPLQATLMGLLGSADVGSGPWISPATPPQPTVFGYRYASLDATYDLVNSFLHRLVYYAKENVADEEEAPYARPAWVHTNLETGALIGVDIDPSKTVKEAFAATEHYLAVGSWFQGGFATAQDTAKIVYPFSRNAAVDATNTDDVLVSTVTGGFGLVCYGLQTYNVNNPIFLGWLQKGYTNAVIKHRGSNITAIGPGFAVYQRDTVVIGEVDAGGYTDVRTVQGDFSLQELSAGATHPANYYIDTNPYFGGYPVVGVFFSSGEGFWNHAGTFLNPVFSPDNRHYSYVSKFFPHAIGARYPHPTIKDFYPGRWVVSTSPPEGVQSQAFLFVSTREQGWVERTGPGDVCTMTHPLTENTRWSFALGSVSETDTPLVQRMAFAGPLAHPYVHKIHTYNPLSTYNATEGTTGSPTSNITHGYRVRNPDTDAISGVSPGLFIREGILTARASDSHRLAIFGDGGYSSVNMSMITEPTIDKAFELAGTFSVHPEKDGEYSITAAVNCGEYYLDLVGDTIGRQELVANSPPATPTRVDIHLPWMAETDFDHRTPFPQDFGTTTYNRGKEIFELQSDTLSSNGRTVFRHNRAAVEYSGYRYDALIMPGGPDGEGQLKSIDVFPGPKLTADDAAFIICYSFTAPNPHGAGTLSFYDYLLMKNATDDDPAVIRMTANAFPTVAHISNFGAYVNCGNTTIVTGEVEREVGGFLIRRDGSGVIGLRPGFTKLVFAPGTFVGYEPRTRARDPADIGPLEAVYAPTEKFLGTVDESLYEEIPVDGLYTWPQT